MDKLKELNQYLFGFKTNQTWTALYMLNEFFKDHEEVDRIVEFGTGEGGLTIFFGEQMIPRHGKVLTFDTTKPDEKWFQTVVDKPIQYHKIDVFSNEAIEMVKKFISGRKCLVFCDNGNKAKELWTYTPILEKGNFIMCHDWGTEVTEEHLNPSEGEPIETDTIYNYCEKYGQEEFDDLDTMILSMVRK